MKKALLILLLASPCLAEGPRYKHKDRAINLEVENIYQDLRGTTGRFIQNGASPTTSTQVFNVSSGTVTGSFNVGNNLHVATTGEVTQPLQPSFMASNSVEDADVTGDSTVVTVDFDSERFDLGGDFANDTFTAPVDGKYQFNVDVLFNEILVSHTNAYIELATSNESYFLYEDSVGAKTYVPFVLSVIVDMDAGDTATVSARVAGSTKTVDIYGDGTSSYTYFSGSLIN